ncbi:hypothetical protein [Clostridium thermobutyricum]|uniref:Uncharacterized protein n=1 Tax=Clostridium thermobutyricum DSM 4928 TaxID=1121339 RepID=A0A1V4SVF3_9CLOT|nr:hypothetical protein [Clostridium thermobutyricum]OPX47914.1 hypothetical protein CLTHE_14850 [Clostridium thermobutyricum DSM 4928]
MIDNKENLEKIRNNLIKEVSDEKFQYEIVRCLKEGNKEFESDRKKNKKPIDSYKSSKGMDRAKKIGDMICNSKEFNKIGVKVDVFLSQGIPVIYLKDIMFTIKSLKDSKDILKNNSDYIKKYSKLNRKLNPQISIDTIFDEESNNFVYNYYGVIVYHISNAGILEFVKFIFLNENTKEILLEISVNKNIINSEEKITSKEPEIVSEDNIKGKSLKKLLRIK